MKKQRLFVGIWLAVLVVSYALLVPLWIRHNTTMTPANPVAEFVNYETWATADEIRERFHDDWKFGWIAVVGYVVYTGSKFLWPGWKYKRGERNNGPA